MIYTDAGLMAFSTVFVLIYSLYGICFLFRRIDVIESENLHAWLTAQEKLNHTSMYINVLKNQYLFCMSPRLLLTAVFLFSEVPIIAIDE